MGTGENLRRGAGSDQICSDQHRRRSGPVATAIGARRDRGGSDDGTRSFIFLPSRVLRGGTRFLTSPLWSTARAWILTTAALRRSESEEDKKPTTTRSRLAVDEDGGGLRSRASSARSGICLGETSTTTRW